MPLPFSRRVSSSFNATVHCRRLVEDIYPGGKYPSDPRNMVVQIVLECVPTGVPPLVAIGKMHMCLNQWNQNIYSESDGDILGSRNHHVENSH